ncbi:MAG: ferredoxin-thioredoxin reductase catalytic domain-containing protein [bacterium]|nr:ferredoxin-thioredoxin reductase catalytic domain-containing protein [bacterium]
MENNKIPKDKIEKIFAELFSGNKKRGYFLNPNENSTKSLIEALLINEQRYGYQACPCRLASGNKEEDFDIICPCDYRDADVAEYETCYCGLYVSKNVFENKKAIKPIPERRPNKVERIKLKTMEKETKKKEIGNLSYSVWRCEVCGYLCAREEAPDVCPICGASKERFARFI